ncbi:MAG: hypothetical protein GY772_29395 [bacterium]|nr:hypothetical protein [bacterium]
MTINILIRKESQDEQKALGSTHLDDLDLVPSSRDGRLVAVAMKHGVHVCWQCGEGFEDHLPARRFTEKRMGYSRVALHSECVNGGKVRSAQSFNDVVRGLQVRRGIAKIAKDTQSVADAADSNDTLVG